MAAQKASPFSLKGHQWSLTWNRVSYNEKFDKPYESQSERVQEALEALACVGVIGGAQMKRLFHLSSENIKNMIGAKLITPHEVRQDGQAIPIYTVGIRGANQVMPVYRPNYWENLKITDVLKDLCFFKLCSFFDDFMVFPAPEPFTASLSLKPGQKRNEDVETPFYVYVTRDGVEDLMMALKWQPFRGRILIVAETLAQAKPLESFMTVKDLKVRLVTDEGMSLDPMIFYHFDKENGKWGLD